MLSILRCGCRGAVSAPVLTVRVRQSLVKRFFNIKQEKDFQFQRSEKRLFMKDGIPNDYKLIYKARMHSYVVAAVCTMIFGTTVIFVGSLHNLGNIDITREYEIDFGASYVKESSKKVYAIGLALIGLLFITGMICKRFMVRIYNKGDNYIGLYQGFLPWNFRKLDFSVGDTIFVPERRIFKHRVSDFKIRGNHTILVEDYFRTPADCHKMIGMTLKQDPKYQ